MEFYLVAAVNLGQSIATSPNCKFKKSENVTPFYYQLLDYCSYEENDFNVFYNKFGSTVVLQKLDIDSREQLDVIYENYDEKYKKIIEKINNIFSVSIKDTDWVCSLCIGDGKEDLVSWSKIHIGDQVEKDAILDVLFVQVSYEMLKIKVDDFKKMNVDSKKLLEFKELFFEMADLIKVDSFRTLKRSIEIGTSIVEGWKIEGSFGILERHYKEELSNYSLHMELKNLENSKSLNSILLVVALLGLAQLSDFLEKKIGKVPTDWFLNLILVSSLLILSRVVFGYLKNYLSTFLKRSLTVKRRKHKL